MQSGLFGSGAASSDRPLEIWSGPECTVNRVGDTFYDQLELTGFAERLDDIDRIASLGVRRMRMPILWERMLAHVDDPVSRIRWSWADARIVRLQQLGVSPIVGLVHHGSGPLGTDLLNPGFAGRLAEFADAVARRYPHVEDYTPINEPLTTARFSALYGLWYPHRRDDASFVRALLNQVQATVLAMRAVRAIRPGARLVQTEDLGRVDSGPRLHYQARFENHRRWLGIDLLAGRVRPDHPLWNYLRQYGADEAELMALARAPMPPDVLGLNIYVTSERYLDDRLEAYPPALLGGNGRDCYVDIETVRVDPRLRRPIGARLREAWRRYRLPLALTEVHLNCTREEQMRWLHQAWQAACGARRRGIDVRAVTAWAALGSYDWNSLLTRRDGRYEPGLWDIGHGKPRETALVGLVRTLATGREPQTPVLKGPGWWQRDGRVLRCVPVHAVQSLKADGPLVLIAGARGTLGQAFARLCTLRGLPFRLLTREQFDIADSGSVERALTRWEPWAVVNAAGFVRVDDAERQGAHWRENVLGPCVLATSCRRYGVRLLSFSSDLVFGGEKALPYVESDRPAPLSVYGLGKHEAEQQVLAIAPQALMVRSAAFFGPWDPYNFVAQMLETLARGESWSAARDQFVSPTYVPDLVNASLDLLVDGESGLWHLANRGAVSWAQFACMTAEAAGFSRALVRPCCSSSLGQIALRPRYSALDSERGQLMPALASGIERFFTERGPAI